MGRCRRLSGADHRSRAAPAPRTRGAYLDAHHPLRAIRLLGSVVAIRAAEHGAGRPRLVRALMSRRHADAICQPPWARTRIAALDHVEGLALRCFRDDDDLRPAHQRLSISRAGSVDPRRLYRGGDGGWGSLWP